MENNLNENNEVTNTEVTQTPIEETPVAPVTNIIPLGTLSIFVILAKFNLLKYKCSIPFIFLE